MELIMTSINQGIIFAVLAIGVGITYKILDFADMSVGGTYPFGGFLFAKFIIMGMSPGISTFLAFVFGTLAGVITYILHIKLRINSLLSGILTMTLLYTVNLRLNGKSNIGLSNYKSVFDWLQVNLDEKVQIAIILLAIALIVKILMDLFLKTEIGYLLVSTGDNETLVKALGEDSNKYKLIGLMLSNGLVALSGALMSQYMGFVEITMGNSIIVVAIASIIVGDTLVGGSRKLKNKTGSVILLICTLAGMIILQYMKLTAMSMTVSIIFMAITLIIIGDGLLKKGKRIKSTTSAIIGALIYKFIGAIAIDIGLPPSDLNAVNALIVIAFLAYNNFGTEMKKISLNGIKKMFKVKGGSTNA